MEYRDKLDELLATVLASCYRSIDWKKAGAKSAYDFMAGRIRIGGRERTIAAALELIARKCPLQARGGNATAFEYDPAILPELEKSAPEVLRRMRSESIYIALLAANLAKEQKLTKGNATLEKFV